MRVAATIALGLFFALLLLASPARASHSLADRVKDGPAANTIRQSLRCLESGEESADDQTKLSWYGQGKTLAEEALGRDPNSADAHFALFANWGRILQTEGWLRNAHHLAALWRELDRALELNPDHAAALGAKGGLYLNLPGFLGGDLAKAEPLLRRSIELDPYTVGSRLELAECYRETERVDQARALASDALRLAQEQEKPRFVTRANEMLRELGPGEQPKTVAGVPSDSVAK